MGHQAMWRLATVCIATAAIAACSSDGSSKKEVAGHSSSALGAVGTAAGFEDDDGNLVDDAGAAIDWNSFASLTWSGTSPTRTAEKTLSGWKFKGFEDYQATTSDTAFAGGTKQDDDCAKVITAKADNKADLKRAYLATTTAPVATEAGTEQHVFLMLGWIRIAQNTTSPSAHVAFEFNKGNPEVSADLCATGSGGLVKRKAGDMLILYDFEGGSDTPVISIARWITSGTCGIGSDSPPCWGAAAALPAGQAEAKVNTDGSVSDALAPDSPPETLGIKEFGEAGIDLTAAGVFTPGVCEAFGQAHVVSRTSGNSGTAQMKDLVGPGAFTLANCGTVITRKVTSPSGDTTSSFGFTTTVTTNPSTTTSPFSLKDGGSNTIINVVPGSYKLGEDDPTSLGYKLTGIDCSASTVPSTSITTDLAGRSESFTIGAGETVDCTYTNTRLGHVRVRKVSSKDTTKGLSGAEFSYGATSGSLTSTGTSDTDGYLCIDGLTVGTNYYVKETKAPSNYQIDDTAEKTIAVAAGSCAGTTAVDFTFKDSPLSDLACTFTSLVTGATTATMKCKDSKGNTVFDGSLPSATATDIMKSVPPDTYTCTIVIDP